MLRQAALQRLACRISYLAAQVLPSNEFSGCCFRHAPISRLLTTQSAQIAAPSASAAACRLLDFSTHNLSISLARGLATEAGEDSPPSTAGSPEDSQDTAAGSTAADGDIQAADSGENASESSAADAAASGAETAEPGESQVRNACMRSPSTWCRHVNHPAPCTSPSRYRH